MQPSRSSNWYLEGLVGDPPSLRQVTINVWPFRVGRRPDLSFCLAGTGVSKEHAEICRDGERIVIRDLNSRNGTFVNGKRIEEDTPLTDGDVIHFANQEFRLGDQTGADAGATMQVDRNEWVYSIGQFDKLLDGDGALPVFQPIVDLPGGAIRGYEVLARSTIDGLHNPAQMFAVAARLNMESALSRLFRREGVRLGRELANRPNLFLNTHPAELSEGGLLESLRELRAEAPEQPLTLEIHEAAITDLNGMRSLKKALREIDVQLAYDDFGAGQARLVDLIEVPPDYLKFDICLVRDIHNASGQRRQMTETLVRMAHDLGVSVLAEGIEHPDEGATCAELGFDLAQGYHYGRPEPVGQAAVV